MRQCAVGIGGRMKKYHYKLSENGWEYTGFIDVESEEKPTIFNSDNEHYLIVNGAKISFDEEIIESE